MPWQTVERVVVVERLGRLAGSDIDRLAGGEEEPGIEESPAQREDPRVQRDLTEDATAGYQRVDALGARPFEVVPAAVAAEVEGEHAPHLGQRGGVEEVRLEERGQGEGAEAVAAAGEEGATGE